MWVRLHRPASSAPEAYAEYTANWLAAGARIMAVAVKSARQTLQRSIKNSNRRVFKPAKDTSEWVESVQEW